MAEPAKKMNVFQLTVLIAVNMMGSGIIMLPTNMAKVGAISLLSWIVTAVGSMAIAYGFAQAGVLNTPLRRHGGLRRGGPRQVGLLHDLLSVLLLARDRERGDRDLGGRLSRDLLPVAVLDADRHHDRRDRADLAHDGGELRRSQRDRAHRRDHGLGRDHPRRRTLADRLVLVQQGDVRGRLEPAGTQPGARAWARASRSRSGPSSAWSRRRRTPTPSRIPSATCRSPACSARSAPRSSTCSRRR